jgi:putative ABC transport system substrate-binding protein
VRRFAASFALTAGLWSAPLLAETKTYRIAILFPGGDVPGAQTLVKALAERGYAEGRNVVFDTRAAGGEPNRLPRLARELVATRPDVIVSATEPAARALIAATRGIPIVLAVIGDPVALGLTRSMARPTENVTGFTTGNDTLASKRVQLLLEMVPASRRVAILWVEGNAQNSVVVDRARQAAAAQKVEIVSLPIGEARDIPAALAKAEREGAGALLVVADPLTIRNRQSIIDECLFRNLPAMHSYAIEARDGALMSYGTDAGEDYGRAAEYVDRILKGAKVAELPFQEPTQIRLVINVRTARSIALDVPMSLLVRADELIE